MNLIRRSFTLTAIVGLSFCIYYFWLCLNMENLKYIDGNIIGNIIASQED